MLKSTLINGVEIDAVLHQTFEMREATIRDAINAIDKRNAAGEGLTSYLTLQMYQAAEQLVSLGDLPKDQITAALLLSLPEDDIAPLLDALEAVKKKPKPAS